MIAEEKWDWPPRAYGVRSEYPRESSIHRIFEAQVERTPAAIALLSGERALTFQELNARANQLAHHLIGLGVGPESLVGVGMRRSIDMVVALLAILKAGGAYVPLDASYPAERLAFMIADTRLSVLLTERALTPVFSGYGAETVVVVGAEAPLTALSSENPGRDMSGDGLAYVMFTSGSTGWPKGVMVTHRGVVRLLMGTRYADFGPDQVFLHAAPISFDASTFEIWGALLHGSKLAILPSHAPTLEQIGQAA